MAELQSRMRDAGQARNRLVLSSQEIQKAAKQCRRGESRRSKKSFEEGLRFSEWRQCTSSGPGQQHYQDRWSGTRGQLGWSFWDVKLEPGIWRMVFQNYFWRSRAVAHQPGNSFQDLMNTLFSFRLRMLQSQTLSLFGASFETHLVAAGDESSEAGASLRHREVLERSWNQH